MYCSCWHARSCCTFQISSSHTCMLLRLSRSSTWRLFWVENICQWEIKHYQNLIFVAVILPSCTTTFLSKHHQSNLNRGWWFWNTLSTLVWTEFLLLFKLIDPHCDTPHLVVSPPVLFMYIAWCQVELDFGTIISQRSQIKHYFWKLPWKCQCILKFVQISLN